MPNLDLESPAMLTRAGSRYPAPHDEPVAKRGWLGLGASKGGTSYPDIDLQSVVGEQFHRHRDEAPSRRPVGP